MACGGVWGGRPHDASTASGHRPAGRHPGRYHLLHTLRMKLNTFRNQELERDPEAMTYWKRRFVALAAGLTVAAAMAWAFSGVLGVSGVSDAAVGHLAAAHDGRAGTSGSGRAGLGGGT